LNWESESHKKFPQLADPDWLERACEAHKTNADIAREVGCSVTTVRRALLREGVERDAILLAEQHSEYFCVRLPDRTPRRPRELQVGERTSARAAASASSTHQG
jgi:hypothetical protein